MELRLGRPGAWVSLLSGGTSMFRSVTFGTSIVILVWTAIGS